MDENTELRKLLDILLTDYAHQSKECREWYIYIRQDDFHVEEIYIRNIRLIIGQMQCLEKYIYYLANKLNLIVVPAKKEEYSDIIIGMIKYQYYQVVPAD